MNNSTTTYKRLGDYIREVDVRNRDLQCTNLLGLSIAKTFIPSIANTVGTDFRPYKVVKHNQFAYVPVTSRNGDKITVALYDGLIDCIISQAYTSFEIINVKELLPEYLMMWFRRPEFDRYARFKSHGSAREVFDWEEMCNVMLPIPSLEEQQRIVDRYNAIQHRIATNKQTIAKLEEAAQALYRKMFVDNIDPENLPAGWRMGTLGEVAEITSGRTCPQKTESRTDDYCFPVAGAAGIIGWSNEYNQDEAFMTTGRVGTLGVVNRYYDKVWASDNVLVLKSQYFEFIYQILRHTNYEDIVKGGVQALITQTDLKNIAIIVADESSLQSYEQYAGAIQSQIKLINKEVEKLTEIRTIMLF